MADEAKYKKHSRNLKQIYRYQPFYVPATLLLVLVIVFYPYLQYYIDPDATAYLTISKRYAEGDYAKAINGYWSPWSCWLSALGIKLGFGVIQSAIIANTCAAVGLAYVTQLFFLKYDVDRFSQWVLQLALAVFLSYAIYYQNFDDLWECFFLLYALRVMVSHRFCYTPWLWVVAGVLGALAYFAKAYAFPFFILSTLCLVFYNTRAWNKKYFTRFLKISSVMIGVMLILSAPWIYALHEKYGMLTTGTAGTLNMSWYLVGHPEYKEGIGSLLPPVYANSPTYWEDPWFVNGTTPHFWDSSDLFVRQLMKIAHNGYKFIVSSMQISVAFLLVVVYTVVKAFKRPKTNKYKVYYCIIIPFLLFPLAFFLINFEPRYIWYMLPLSMLLGILILRKNDWNKKWLIAVFALSYIVYPINGIRKMWNDGKDEYEFSQMLRQQNVKGGFVTNGVYGMYHSVSSQRIAYFSGCSYYPTFVYKPNFQILLKELRTRNIKYYVYYGDGVRREIVDENGTPFALIAESKDVRIYSLTQN